MKNRTVLKLLGVFHITLFLIFAGCISFILSKSDYFDDYDKEQTVVELAAEPETVIANESEIETEIETESEAEIKTEPETELEPETEAEPVYFNGVKVPFNFQFSGHSRLNIRNQPSTKGEIIGKIPKNKIGTVTGVYDDKWVMVTFEGVEGYCSAKWIVEVMDEDN